MSTTKNQNTKKSNHLNIRLSDEYVRRFNEIADSFPLRPTTVRLWEYLIDEMYAKLVKKNGRKPK